MQTEKYGDVRYYTQRLGNSGPYIKRTYRFLHRSVLSGRPN